MIKNINYLHFQELESTNQKTYQLAEQATPQWTVVWCDHQSQGKGYASNIWNSKPYHNATFSFLLREIFNSEHSLPVLNMWISLQLTGFLTKWHMNAKVKWPNDIMVNNKKIAGVLIENKLSGNCIKFTVIGIGVNIMQTNFEGFTATSIKTEKPEISITPKEFISGFMEHVFNEYVNFQPKNYEEILRGYNSKLYKKNVISVFDSGNKIFNGIIRGVTASGNLCVELEDGRIQEFRHKEITLLS